MKQVRKLLSRLQRDLCEPAVQLPRFESLGEAMTAVTSNPTEENVAKIHLLSLQRCAHLNALPGLLHEFAQTVLSAAEAELDAQNSTNNHRNNAIVERLVTLLGFLSEATVSFDPRRLVTLAFRRKRDPFLLHRTLMILNNQAPQFDPQDVLLEIYETVQRSSSLYYFQTQISCCIFGAAGAFSLLFEIIRVSLDLILESDVFQTDFDNCRLHYDEEPVFLKEADKIIPAVYLFAALTSSASLVYFGADFAQLLLESIHHRQISQFVATILEKQSAIFAQEIVKDLVVDSTEYNSTRLLELAGSSNQLLQNAAEALLAEIMSNQEAQLCFSHQDLGCFQSFLLERNG